MQRFRAARAAGRRRRRDARRARPQERGRHARHARLCSEAAAALERACVEGARDADIDDMVHEVSNVLDEVIDELRTLESARVS